MNYSKPGLKGAYQSTSAPLQPLSNPINNYRYLEFIALWLWKRIVLHCYLL